MGNLKRNDKVFVLERYTSRPKYSLTIGVLPGKMMISIEAFVARTQFVPAKCCSAINRLEELLYF
jgi:hypothetical protein